MKDERRLAGRASGPAPEERDPPRSSGQDTTYTATVNSRFGDVSASLQPQRASTKTKVVVGTGIALVVVGVYLATREGAATVKYTPPAKAAELPSPFGPSPFAKLAA